MGSATKKKAWFWIRVYELILLIAVSCRIWPMSSNWAHNDDELLDIRHRQLERQMRTSFILAPSFFLEIFLREFSKNINLKDINCMITHGNDIPRTCLLAFLKVNWWRQSVQLMKISFINRQFIFMSKPWNSF